MTEPSVAESATGSVSATKPAASICPVALFRSWPLTSGTAICCVWAVVPVVVVVCVDVVGDVQRHLLALADPRAPTGDLRDDDPARLRGGPEDRVHVEPLPGQLCDCLLLLQADDRGHDLSFVAVVAQHEDPDE